MTALISCDGHFVIIPDGRVFAKGIYGYSYWERYLDVFDEILVVGKAKHVEVQSLEYQLTSGNNLTFIEIPFYQGPREFLKKYFSIIKAIRKIKRQYDCFILRGPSPVSIMLYQGLKKSRPKAIEVVTNPSDSFVNENGKKKNAGIFSLIQHYFLKYCITKFNGVSYVTERILEKEYPCVSLKKGESKEYFHTHYSSIDLKGNHFFEKNNFNPSNSITLTICDASIFNNRKGEKQFLDIMKVLKDRGYPIRGIIIGDGPDLIKYKLYAEQHGLRDQVVFTGFLNSLEITDWLKESDFFVLPSKSEGLPRVLIEAMATSVPCIASNVGGISEIIDAEFIFNRNDVLGMANTIEKYINDTNAYYSVGRRNYLEAQNFRFEILRQRRVSFYMKLKILSEQYEGE